MDKCLFSVEKKPQSKYTPKSNWAAHLIRRILSYTYQVWKTRSKQVHEILDAEATSEQHIVTDKSIAEKYNALLREVRARERLLL